MVECSVPHKYKKVQNFFQHFCTDFYSVFELQITGMMIYFPPKTVDRRSSRRPYEYKSGQLEIYAKQLADVCPKTTDVDRP